MLHLPVYSRDTYLKLTLLTNSHWQQVLAKEGNAIDERLIFLMRILQQYLD